MENGARLRVAVVGLGFGGSFPEIYRAHPDVAEVALCDTNADRLAAFAGEHGFAARYARLDDLLADGRWDAVHLVTPIPLHARQAVAVLQAGKHCACTVPAATSLDDLRALVAAQRESGRNYMMMETAVYTYHYLMAAAMRDAGELGALFKRVLPCCREGIPDHHGMACRKQAVEHALSHYSSAHQAHRPACFSRTARAG